MADTRTTVRWDSVGAEKVKKDYAEITAANDRTAAGFQKTGDAASKAGDGVDKLGRGTRDYASHAKVASTSTEALNVGLATLARYASAGALLELGRRTVMAADTFKGLQNSLRVAGLESDALTAATGRLFEMSKRTFTSVEANATLYGRLAQAQKELGASSEQLFTFTEAVGNSLRINGTEAQAAAGGLLQLSQMMGGSVVQAQEFNSLVDAMPPLLRAAAKHIDGTGGSIAGLKELVKSGGLETKVFFEAVLQGSADLAKEAEKAQTRVGQSLENLKTAYIEASGSSAGLAAASDLTAKSIGVLADRLGVMFGLFDDAAEPILAVASAIRDLADATERYASVIPDDDIKRIEEFNKRVFRPGGLVRYMYEHFSGINIKPPGLDASSLPNMETPDFLSGYRQDRPFGHTSSFAPLPTDAEMKKIADGIKDWQDKVADGWRDLYDKVGEASADFTRKIEEDAREGGAKFEESERKRRAAIEQTIEAIQFETTLIGLSNDAKEKAIAMENQRKAGASDDQLRRTGLAIDVNQAKQAAQDAADEVTAIWDDARRDFSDAWSDMFTDIFDGGKFSFKKFTDSLKNMWARLLADLLTLSLKNSFIDPLFDSLTGSSAGGIARTHGAFDKVFDGPDDSVSRSFGGLGDDMRKSLFDPLKKGLDSIFGEGFAKSAGGIVGGAAVGAGLGGLVGSSTGGAIGGALGQMFGPIGGLVGSLIGGLVGSLFKSTPRSISSITTIGATAGIGDSYASGLDIKIGQSAAKTVANALNEFARSIDLSLDSDAFIGMIGQRGKKFFFQSQESDIKKAGKGKYGAVKFDDAESAIAAAIEAALENGIIDGLSDVDMKLLRAATDVQEGMQKVIARKDFIKELDFQYMGITDPLGEQLARLKDWYNEQLKLAEEYEVDKTKIDALYADKRKKIIEQYNEQLYGGLKDFLTSITAGSASTLSPTTRLGLASANYSTLLSKARAGDEDAIGALQGAAQDYLTAGRDVFASSGGYQDIYNRVVADISSITGVANPLTGGASMSSVAAAVNDNTRTQITFLSRAQSQRDTTNSLLQQNLAVQQQIAASLQRLGISSPTQNGVVPVGTVNWSNLAVGW